MKVLHVEGGMHLYGGARQVLYLIEGLRKRGVSNILVCPRGSAIAKAARPYVDVLKPMPMHGDVDFPFVFRLTRLIKDYMPDLVHLHSRRGVDLLGGSAAWLAGCPCVLSRRVDNPESIAWVAVKYRLYDHVVTISRAIHDLLVREGLPEERVTCVRSAVDASLYDRPCERTAFLNELALPPDALIVAVVAQLIRRKGHRHLLAIAPALLKRFPQVRIVFFGRGPLHNELREMSRSLKVSHAIVFAGFREDLDRWLPCVDILAHPAYMEGLGVSLLQAAAAGVPLVASGVGGIPEIVRDQENGFIVSPENEAELESALATLIADSALRRKFHEAGRELVRREFSVGAMVEGNLEIYRRVLSKARH
jgi:glycosyltransferase involved in cell wall biosynthesis